MSIRKLKKFGGGVNDQKSLVAPAIILDISFSALSTSSNTTGAKKWLLLAAALHPDLYMVITEHRTIHRVSAVKQWAPCQASGSLRRVMHFAERLNK